MPTAHHHRSIGVWDSHTMLITEAATARHPLGARPCLWETRRHGDEGHRPSPGKNRRGIRRSNLAGCSCTAVMLPFPVEPASLHPANPFPLVLVTRSLPLLAKAFLAGTELRYVPSDVSFLSTCPFGKSMCPADNGLEWATKPNSFQPMPMTLAGYCWYCSGPWPCLEGSFPSNTRASLGLLFIQPNAQNDSDLTTRGHNVMAPGVFNNTSFMFIVSL